jgi:hypothetical protein
MTGETAPVGRVREIGIAGTIARVGVGGILLGSVVVGHTHTFRPLPWVVGLGRLPGDHPGVAAGLRPAGAAALAGHQFGRRSAQHRRVPRPVPDPVLRAGHRLASDTALLFYGASMLLAAARGYADRRNLGCFRT